MAALPGLTALIGPLSNSAANHVRNMAEQMKLPLLETRVDFGLTSPDFTFNIHPHPTVLGRAYVDLIKALGWKSLVILFQTEESLVKLQEILKLPQTFDDIRVVLRQLDLTTDDYRPLLKEMKKSGETRIVLDCDFDKIESILRQADEIGLVNEYTAYLITNLDLERLDLSNFRYRMVNITGFSIVDTSNPDIPEYVSSWPTSLGPKKGKLHPLYVKTNLRMPY